MKTVTEYLWFNTKQRHEFINITDKVKDAGRERAGSRKVLSWYLPCILRPEFTSMTPKRA